MKPIGRFHKIPLPGVVDNRSCLRCHESTVRVYVYSTDTDVLYSM